MSAQVMCGACAGSGVNAHSGAEFGCAKTVPARVGMGVKAIKRLKTTSGLFIPDGSAGEILEVDARTGDVLVSFQLFGDGIWFKSRLFREDL